MSRTLGYSLCVSSYSVSQRVLCCGHLMTGGIMSALEA